MVLSKHAKAYPKCPKSSRVLFTLVVGMTAAVSVCVCVCVREFVFHMTKKQLKVFLKRSWKKKLFQIVCHSRFKTFSFYYNMTLHLLVQVLFSNSYHQLYS